MWIKTIVLVSCVLATLAADEQRSKKKEDPRGKRNLQYSIAHHFNGPHALRRISTGPQIPLYHSQFFPGPRSYSPFHQGRPHSLPAPPYAVQMEPLVHYSQRDPLYDTNSLSLNTDGQGDLLTDNNHLSENVYGPQKHIVERPVYVKEPEPIIEIIIKESNVTLPPPPAPPTPPPKKKEQVQVFYVKYKKNPDGHGKDSIIYDKPIPAISPPIHDEQEEAPPQNHHHEEAVTLPPPPSTTLRTIIRPDSETYHSPSGVKVTFGKEGFDYDKRSNKPEDLKASPDDNNRSVQFPQGRQLSQFPPSISRRPAVYSFTPPPGYREPQPYRPFSQYRQQTSHSFPRPNQQEYSTLPKFPPFSQPPKSSQSFPPPRPLPPQFQRQPVPYQPFESLRHQSPQFRPETHFPITQAPPINQRPIPFNQFREQRPQIPEPRPQQKPQFGDSRPQLKPEFVDSRPQLKPEFVEPRPQPKPQFSHPRPQSKQQYTESKPPTKPQFSQKPQYQPVQQQYQQQPQFHQPENPQFHQPENPQFQQYQQRPSIPQPQPPAQYQQQPYQQQFQQFNPQPSIIPPGGELIQSVPKYEQHISVSEPIKPSPQPDFQNQQSQYQIQPQPQQSSIQFSSDYNNKQQPQVEIQQSSSGSDYKKKIEQQLREANAFQESIRQSSPQLYNFQQSQSLNYYQSTSKPTTYSTTTYSTTQSTTTTQKPSTTTKDPKLLNAQLPDEVPEDLRQQLLSSGILNHADISVLDYDKVGDIPLSALPPDQLSNFFSAGGAQQIQAAGSEPIPAITNRDFDEAASEIREVTVKPEVQMKVVRYDPESDRGQQVQESYVKDDATQVEPVVLNDEKYNRYLPLKISGTQFPIPDVPELKGKKITSVVVLAPVAYDFSSSRQTREAKDKEIELLEGDVLKDLLKNPTKANFEKFLEKENQTRSDKQAVILLVTGPNETTKDKEIFMYDIATKSVSKLDGELSSAFVNAAEANYSEEPKTSASEIVETRVPYKVPIIDPQGDLEAEGSEHLESFVDFSGIPVEDDLTASETHVDSQILGISKTGRLS